ncbi:hypothetical protein FQA39_LY08897 [Lamprigera yunnana]|nr:hypothetical protein FQA39_LY08897 [Lamprigera yunnana]
MMLTKRILINFCIIAWMSIDFSGINVLAHEEDSENSRCYDKSKEICTTQRCVQNAANIISSMDETVDPCHDFYKFVCGGFVKNAIIPDDSPMVSSFTILNERVIQQMRLALEELLQLQDAKPFGLVKKFYGVCMNTTEIDNNAVNVTIGLLNKVGGWPVLQGENWNEDNFDWKSTTYQFRKMGIPSNSLISIFPGVHSYNSSKYIINCDQARLGLDREHLVEGFEHGFVKIYYEYLIDLAVIFGADRRTAETELKDSVLFEIALAKITLSKEERRNVSTLTNIMPLSTIVEKFPVIPWREFLQNLANSPNIVITEDEELDIGVPQFLIDLNTLLQNTPKRVLANYILSQVILYLVPYSTTKTRTRKLEFSKAFHGAGEMKPRWRECTEQSNSALKILSSALYVRKYFNDDDRKSAKTLVDSLRNEFNRILKTVDWMDEETRGQAQKKLLKMNARVGYPSELLNDAKIEEYYGALNFSANTLIELSLSIYKFHEDNTYERLREVVNRTDWKSFTTATQVNAYYNFVDNGIQLPAGILQGVFFDGKRPNYLNFGSMGFAIGHEITHGFDDMGRQFNDDGFLQDWWKDQTTNAFLHRARCIIDQYSNYTSTEVNLKINGVNTQGENIADNGGIKQAYLAYKNWVERNGVEPLLPGLKYTQKQLFWISLANLWCVKERKEFLMQEILTDFHPPSDIRVLGVISNSEHFGDDFNCKVESRMNPAHKCSVW